ncbi:hypothetical protein NDU88_007953 [Pleurodeles waltl]|uniref:Uncharacterized protein n=1 Tax=Pleurodeles waltl TaxID=8319 RepID=A0AAV7NUJ0_PLEWA|nr:hypothetical protein NDU88_007953 [Pleurodeles waltl]
MAGLAEVSENSERTVHGGPSHEKRRLGMEPLVTGPDLHSARLLDAGSCLGDAGAPGPQRCLTVDPWAKRGTPE